MGYCILFKPPLLLPIVSFFGVLSHCLILTSLGFVSFPPYRKKPRWKLAFLCRLCHPSSTIRRPTICPGRSTKIAGFLSKGFCRSFDISRSWIFTWDHIPGNMGGHAFQGEEGKFEAIDHYFTACFDLPPPHKTPN